MYKYLKTLLFFGTFLQFVQLDCVDAVQAANIELSKAIQDAAFENLSSFHSAFKPQNVEIVIRDFEENMRQKYLEPETLKKNAEDLYKVSKKCKKSRRSKRIKQLLRV